MDISTHVSHARKSRHSAWLHTYPSSEPRALVVTHLCIHACTSCLHRHAIRGNPGSETTTVLTSTTESCASLHIRSAYTITQHTTGVMTRYVDPHTFCVHGPGGIPAVHHPRERGSVASDAAPAYLFAMRITWERKHVDEPRFSSIECILFFCLIILAFSLCRLWRHSIEVHCFVSSLLHSTYI